ncbi:MULTISPECIES: HAD family acid phosphatase [unclassified Saccharopolyspora]|uniref:HAD family acid phosphatase n=1 Tax=unclassified Saccharopolyspora TaxID=2646250 RepID=UPI001CD52B6B|nr:MULTISPECIES: HAD family acid phosphatase [unclassified Saccharopolyspora]MCA1190627.1 HAD family acid phosphatase [Saccharopolyspora sp. 6V]MCA1229735.1 HAD family acid phosphatase [Saccharopolyspora sp. 6M]
MAHRRTGLAKLGAAAAIGATLAGGVTAVASESAGTEPANLGRAKLAVQDYYGDRVDSDGNHHATEGSAWDRQVDEAVAHAEGYLRQRLAEGVPNPAIVLDVDDTSELTYGWEADNDFGFDEEKQREAIDDAEFEPIRQTRALANWAAEHGVRVYFLTGRGDDLQKASLRNLADEGFPEPAGAFFKPTTEAPEHLPCGLDCSTVEYKSATRAHIESLGSTIVLNLGDQHSDLQGGHAEKPVKLPNPMYYLP